MRGLSRSVPWPRCAVAGALAVAAVALLVATDGRADSLVRVDRRIELLALLFHLAGAPGYAAPPTSNDFLERLERQFAPFKGDQAVVATRRLIVERGLDYQDPIALAVHLQDDLSLGPEGADWPASLDVRWKGELDAYLALVRAFRQRSGFDDFYATESAFLERVEGAFRQGLSDIRPTAWFDDFFEVRGATKHRVSVSLLLGTSNYGPLVERPSGEIEAVQALGVVCSNDCRFGPEATRGSARILVHESAHAFVNARLARHSKTLEPALRTLFSVAAPAMGRINYGRWEIVVNESVVRALTILYFSQAGGAGLRATEKGGDAGRRRRLLLLDSRLGGAPR